MDVEGADLLVIWCLVSIRCSVLTSLVVRHLHHSLFDNYIIGYSIITTVHSAILIICTLNIDIIELWYNLSSTTAIEKSHTVISSKLISDTIVDNQSH